jgi:hypothetical protein
VTICFCMTSLEWNRKKAIQYFLGKLCNKGGLHNYVCVPASRKSHTFSCYILWPYNMRRSNICTKVRNIIKIRWEILMTVTARVTVFFWVWCHVFWQKFNWSFKGTCCHNH